MDIKTHKNSSKNGVRVTCGVRVRVKVTRGERVRVRVRVTRGERLVLLY